MTDETRHIDVVVSNGIDQTEGELESVFKKECDEPFLDNIHDLKVVAGENAGIGPGYLNFKTDSDPEAMIVEVEYFLSRVYDNVSATLQPAEEEIEAALNEVKA